MKPHAVTSQAAKLVVTDTEHVELTVTGGDPDITGEELVYAAQVAGTLLNSKDVVTVAKALLHQLMVLRRMKELPQEIVGIAAHWDSLATDPEEESPAEGEHVRDFEETDSPEPFWVRPADDVEPTRH